MKKLLISVALGVAALAAYVVIDLKTDPECSRVPASVPLDYESQSGCEKQKVLWQKIQSTAYAELPAYCKFGLPQLIGMGTQELTKKKTYSDFAPEGWVKFLHRRAAVAKVKIVPKGGKFTGIFEGAECGLLRLSLTYAPSKSRPVAPGLALKILRTGWASANISALVSLDGQGKDYDFFRNPMSNIVPIGGGFGQKMVHRIFSRVSRYPEELLLNDLAAINSFGERPKSVSAPRQLFFVPDPSLGFSGDAHDVREDFRKVRSGTTLYRVYALPSRYADYDYSTYTAAAAVSFLRESDHVADIVTTSEFVASSFGDEGILFRHELRP